MIKNIFRLFGAAMVICFLNATISCSHQKSIIQDPRMLLDYNLMPNDSTLAHLSDDYRTTIDKVKKRDSVKAGVYADYAVTLALAMRFDEADTFFDKEMASYPESRQYVTFLKDNMTSAAGRERMAQRRIQDSIDREAAKKEALGNDFEFEKIRYPKGSKEYKQQQREKKAARKAKQKEREQMRDDRDSQKKAAQKEREQQKKTAQKEREKQKKEALKEREQKKKETQAAREQQKKQQQTEREQKREQLQKEREQKRQQAAKNTASDTTNTQNK